MSMILAVLLAKTMDNTEKIQVAVYIPDSQVAKWALFNRYYEHFSLLLEHDIFNQKNASIILNFDSEGVLRTIRREDVLFNRQAKSYPQVKS